MKSNCAYTPHLTIEEVSLPPAGEWQPDLPSWTLVRIALGSGYWIGTRVRLELQTGAVLLLSARADGNLRASLLGDMLLQFFSVEPGRLLGLLALSEQRFLDLAAAKDEYAARAFLPESQLATAMKELCAERVRAGTRFRIRLLQLFIQTFGEDLALVARPQVAAPDAEWRLRAFLTDRPAADLLQISAAELAHAANCTQRHLNRIFGDVVGMSFRDKRTELRLAKACELLATTDSKVVDVALESGYQSLSLFNLMFTRRFGIAPGKWRVAHRRNTVRTMRSARSALECPAYA
jgi:AraC-like DNA-binding protein